MRFDSKLEPEVEAVLEVAALLDTSEINVFRLALARWYGACPTKSALERTFVRYMFNGHVPVSVRSFTRQVLEESRAGWVDPARYGVEEPPPSARLVLAGRLYTVALLAVFTFFVVLSVDFPSEALLDIIRSCYFPPCY